MSEYTSVAVLKSRHKKLRKLAIQKQKKESRKRVSLDEIIGDLLKK